MSHIRHLLLAILTLVFCCTGSAKAAHCCGPAEQQSEVMACCVAHGTVPPSHECCKQKLSSTHACSQTILGGCCCGTIPVGVPTAFSLNLMPEPPLSKSSSIAISWRKCNAYVSLKNYEPPNLRRPREKIYLITCSLLI